MQTLLSTEQIQARIVELGAEIERDYPASEGIHLVGVLKGGFMFMADLVRAMSPRVTLDFIAVSSYGAATKSSGEVRLLKDLDTPLQGRDVIIVEDIVDTGMTLNHVIDYLQTKRPASIRVCTLLDKRARRIVNVPLDYVAFEIPDEFVVGYGLDFHQRFRNLPFIAILKHDLLP